MCYKCLDRYKDTIKMAEMKEIMMNYDIVLCTCNETCSQRLLTLAEGNRIAQCIIDECGMANEPETIAAASLCDHVVLIGDHKQLQPVIKYSPAKECGLGISLFERYASMIERGDKDQFKDHLITLQIQYRMVNICIIITQYNHLFIYSIHSYVKDPLNAFMMTF